jgi:L-threonylcarbamoyladenylate synthase
MVEFGSAGSDDREHAVAARVVPIDPAQPDLACLEQAGGVLRSGRLVAFPTETVYGLGANALDPAAVARIFAAKGRPANDPLIVHVTGPEQLDLVAADLPELGRRLASAFWPGALTLVLPRAAAVPDSVTAGLGTVAVRVPAHPIALGLIQFAGVPVAAPSANRFSRPSPTTAAHVLADLGDAVDLILDGGPTPIGLESTIVDVSCAGMPRLLRPGGVPVEELQSVVGPIEMRPAPTDDQAAQPSPGLLTKHYAPRARVLLVAGERESARARLAKEIAQAVGSGTRVGALLVDEDHELVAGLPVLIAGLGSERRLEEAAERLFAAIRSLDEAGVDVIAARGLGTSGLGLALLDRLTRAASGQVIDAGR